MGGDNMTDWLSMDAKSLLWCGAMLYGLSFTYAFISLRIKRKQYHLVFYILLTVGFAFQSVGLYERGLIDQSFPLNNTFEILQVIGWSAVMIEFVIRPAFNIRMLGFFTAALSACLCLLSFSTNSWDTVVTVPTDPRNPWISFHAAIAVFSYGIFAILAVTSVMYLIQHRGLERRQTGEIFTRLPSVKQLDNIGKRLLLAGVSLLTIAIAMGFANLLKEQDGVGYGKLIAAMIVWLSYLITYRIRVSKRLIASQFAWACVLLFLLALLSLWPLNAPVSATEATSTTIKVRLDG